jgi:NTP pyrophosphatase (non-canonical NTP hydrolase)
MTDYGGESGHELHPLREPDNMFPTLDTLQARLGEIFGERDRIYFDERYARIRLFEVGVADLFDALRRTDDPAVLEAPCARVVARVFCIANSFERLSVAEGMAEKFPLEGCVYCGAIPCVCEGRRDDAILSNPNQFQKDWSLRHWQRHLDIMYGDPNRAKGIWFCTMRLATETNELVTAEDNVRAMTIEHVKAAYRQELADSLAWTIAIANILDVDLQNATENRFGNGCETCGTIPCSCSRHNMQQVKFG